MTDECLFCRIATGDVPADRVVERERVIAFRDIAPAAPSHVLVIPTAHVGDARDVGDEHGALLAEMIDVANEVARLDRLDGGYRLIFNVGPDAGQTVFHLHLHVLGGAPLGPMVGR